MRSVTLVTSGSIVGLFGLAGVLLLPTDESRATPQSSPERLALTGHIRDFPPGSAHVDFQVNPSATPGARSAMNVSQALDAEMKPVKNAVIGKRVNNEWTDSANRKIAWCSYSAAMGDNAGSFQNGAGGNDGGGISSPASFGQWFRDVPGVNMSRLWTIYLDRQPDGSYMYDIANFNPIDNQLFGNGFDEHNFYFTYEIVVEYTAEAGQWINFKGDDDFWGFIVGPGYPQGKLLIDHGGIAANREQHYGFDRLLPANGGGLQVGEEYKLHLFFAERCQPQSQFRLSTNIELKTAGDGSVFAVYD